MKKQNEKNNEVKVKKERAKKLFFLYADDKGFICEGANGLPTIGWKNPITYTERKMAVCAVGFFKMIKLASKVSVFMNIA